LRNYTNLEKCDIELAKGMGVSYVHPVRLSARYHVYTEAETAADLRKWK
jgi:hypothetical protein